MMVVLWYSIKSIRLLLIKYYNLLEYYISPVISMFQNLMTATQIDGDIYKSNQEKI